MGRLTLIVVFSLLYLQWGDAGAPIPAGKEYVYSYTGVVRAKNSRSDEYIPQCNLRPKNSGSDVYSSQWNIAAKLIMQSNGDNIVMRFDDIKSSIFNGEVKNFKNAEEKSIPEEAHKLYLPFVVHYHKNGSASSLSHQPDDPLWSLNMKRAIASIVQIDTDNTEHLHGKKFYEESIYGSCQVEYSVGKHDDFDKTVSKTINDELCTESLEHSWSSLTEAPAMPEGFSPITTNVVRTYNFVQKDDTFLLKHVKSNSNITYQTMHCERSSLQLVQSQVFDLVSDSAVSEPIDVTKNTKSTSLLYFHDDEDESFGRRKKEKPLGREEMLLELKGYYDEFKAEFHKYPLVPGAMGFNNSLRSLFASASHVDVSLLEGIYFATIFSGHIDTHFIYNSLIPYIGTNESLEFIWRAANDPSIILYDLLIIRVMGTFPKYVNEYTSDLLKHLEIMMNPKRFRNVQVKRAGILSFAAMVGEANVRADIPVKDLQHYLTMYYKNFTDAAVYGEKMTFLLGLVNMGNMLDTDIMISIINDEEQSHHIRSLAAYGFKPYLSTNPENMFRNFWPVVQNQKEHFEVRVAVLDLLMSSDLSSEEFNMIIEHFKNKVVSKDPFEKHLQNYLLTTLKSLQNTTMYSDYLGAMASELDITMTSHYDAWSTGNYRIGYTDTMPNFGRYFQARLVSNPVTNGINVVQLSYNEFAMSLNLGTYTAYIKLDGVVDFLFASKYLNERPDYKTAIPQLLELINKLKYKHVEHLDNVHIEIVLFCDDRVVLGMHFNKDSMKNPRESQMLEQLLYMLMYYEYVSFPKMYMGYMRTDLGTRVANLNMETNIGSHNLTMEKHNIFHDIYNGTKAELTYRSSRYTYVVLESYNPLLDTHINVYKYKSMGQRVHLPLSVNITGKYLTYENEEDSFNLVLDRTIGTSVDNDEILKTHCKSCEMDIKIPAQVSKEKLIELEEINAILNVTVTKDYNEPSRENLLATFGYYKRNSMTFQMAEPVLAYFYAWDYYRYLGPETGSLSVRNKLYYKEPTENFVQWDLDIDDVYDENDPINGTELTAYLTLSCRKKQDAKILGTFTVNYAYSDGPVSYDTATHIEHRHRLRVNYTKDTLQDYICFDRVLQYPSRNPNKLSISLPKPAKGNGRFSTGNGTMCSDDEFSIKFSDTFELKENQMENVQNMEVYKICQQDSAGFKYTPPTEACRAVHEAVQKYNNYTLYFDLKNAFSDLDEKIRTSDRGFKFLEVDMIRDNAAHFTISKDLLYYCGMKFEEGLQFTLDSDLSVELFNGMEKPTVIAYGDYDVVIGFSRTCDITPSKISTFTYKDIENYESDDGKEIVAYVECIDETRGGMTIQKFSDKKIGFTMWSGNDTLITSVAGDKLKVALNGVELHEQYISNPHFKVYFLADDVLYITNQIVEVYYNTEYISIKAPSMYNNYICGLCAYEERRNADNLVK